MAGVILWSELARDDLRKIVEYIAQDNPAAARAMGYRLIAAVESLQEFPRRARVVPEYGRDNLREVLVGRYRVVVHSDAAANAIIVARLWHSARGFPKIPSLE
jgi:plasmid stabilization system protein ParE